MTSFHFVSLYLFLAHYSRTTIGTLTPSNRKRPDGFYLFNLRVLIVFSSYLEHYSDNNDIHRSRSDVQLYHKSPPCYRKTDQKKDESDESGTAEEDVEELISTYIIYAQMLNHILFFISRRSDQNKW